MPPPAAGIEAIERRRNEARICLPFEVGGGIV
jgi:hypothetical protein